MNYIGSKVSLIDFLHTSINDATGYKDGDNYIFADVFAGTGAVGSYYKSLGCNVISNDLQYYSYVLNKHYIENDKKSIDYTLFNYFNSLEGCDGFIYNNYCIGSGSQRNYFTDENGRKCDAIRIELERMKDNKEIDESNYYFYLGSLINSIDNLANTASVYSSFLKQIKKSASKQLGVEPLKCIEGQKGKVYNQNATELIKSIKGNVLYLDPPYNTRQYCDYYHVLETIARYDNPKVHGVTGQRENKGLKSEFCSKNSAIVALYKIIANADFEYIFLSYNNEGIIPFNEIQKLMEMYGEYSLYTQNYKRYQADRKENRNIKSDETIEYLHCLKKKRKNA